MLLPSFSSILNIPIIVVCYSPFTGEPDTSLRSFLSKRLAAHKASPVDTKEEGLSKGKKPVSPVVASILIIVNEPQAGVQI